MKLSIIIPVYNEEGTIEEVLRRVAQAQAPGFEKEIIVVDDGSGDNSKLKIQKSKLPASLSLQRGEQFKIQNFKIISHQKNLGKGEAVKTGLAEATGHYVLIQDADLEYHPADYPKLLAAVSDQAPVVYGSRNLQPERRGYFHYFLGVKFLTGLVNFLYKTKLTDIYTGYKVFSADLLRSLNLQSRGFDFEAEVTVKLLRQGIKITEVPISYNPRKFQAGKKIRLKDGLVGLWIIIRYWVSGLKC